MLCYFFPQGSKRITACHSLVGKEQRNNKRQLNLIYSFCASQVASAFFAHAFRPRWQSLAESAQLQAVAAVRVARVKIMQSVTANDTELSQIQYHKTKNRTSLKTPRSQSQGPQENCFRGRVPCVTNFASSELLIFTLHVYDL